MQPSNDRWLVCRVGSGLAAIELSFVIEVMRPLPIERVAGAMETVLGASIIRGAPTPVVDLARLVTGTSSEVARFITVRAGSRAVALAVRDVVGVRVIPPAALVDLPPLLRSSEEGLVTKLSARDGELMAALSTARVVHA